MMDTVLNLGLNDSTVEAFAEQLGDQGLPMIPIAVLYKCMQKSFWALTLPCLKK